MSRASRGCVTNPALTVLSSTIFMPLRVTRLISTQVNFTLRNLSLLLVKRNSQRFMINQNPLLDRSAKYCFSYFGRVLTLRYFRTPLAQQIHLASESSNGRTLKTVQQNNELICFCSAVWKAEPREVGFAAE